MSMVIFFQLRMGVHNICFLILSLKVISWIKLEGVFKSGKNLINGYIKGGLGALPPFCGKTLVDYIVLSIKNKNSIVVSEKYLVMIFLLIFFKWNNFECTIFFLKFILNCSKKSVV